MTAFWWYEFEGGEKVASSAREKQEGKDWAVVGMVATGVPQLRERVKKVSVECYKMEREEGFCNYKAVKMQNDLVAKKSETSGYDKS
ncbi:1-aminocyclopropane-1-carboxylate oxidase 5-like [Rhododendron vialii]|uniref:1-aminocyclopropane-1-carboxylate oxidase 5-like n=1 Tax=Rhododendron vialii TaxID=182163 RepID=UPI0026600CA0|nr:1-aminocyclopropane-1-carboxylate oxidase 5-like [Rhododendron vialii]